MTDDTARRIADLERRLDGALESIRSLTARVALVDVLYDRVAGLEYYLAEKLEASTQEFVKLKQWRDSVETRFAPRITGETMTSRNGAFPVDD